MDPFQLEVARAALVAARQYGFALAGGHALMAHGIVSRPTEDVDLFTDKDGGVAAAAELVRAALLGAGLDVDTVTEAGDLGEIFHGFEDDLAEFEVRRGQRTVRLQLVRFDRGRSPVILDIGPVLHLDDVLGTKVAAMVTRGEPRDFLDVGAASTYYSRAELLDLGRRADPALSDDEFRDAMRRLDRLPDAVFALYRLTPEQVGTLRGRFAQWAR